MDFPGDAYHSTSLFGSPDDLVTIRRIDQISILLDGPIAILATLEWTSSFSDVIFGRLFARRKIL